MNLIQAQKEWDEATNAYSRRPNAENWQRFIDCKRIVLALREPLVRDLRTPEKKTDDKIYDFLLSLYPQIIESKKIMRECNITKDKMRHALLKLLSQDKIEKIKTGYYKAIKE